MILFLVMLSLLTSEYVDLQRGFKIEILEDYQVTVVHDRNPFLYVGKDLVNGSYPNLNIVQAENDSMVDINQVVAQLNTRLPEYVLLKKEKLVFQDSENGFKVYGKWRLQGKELKNIQYYFMMSGHLYVVTGTSLAVNFDKDLIFFERTVFSITKLKQTQRTEDD